MIPLDHCECGQKFSDEARGVCWGCATAAVDAGIADYAKRLGITDIPDGYTLVLKADLAKLAKIKEASTNEA